MLGAILALGFAAFFGANSIVVRRGVLRASSNYIATLTVFSGPIFFFLLTLATGELFKIPGFSWKAILFFALSGIIHFALGRTFGYRSVQILGATRSGIMTGLNAIVSVALAVTILKETITPLMIVGMCFSLSGPTIIALKEGKALRIVEPKVNGQTKTLDRKTYYWGLFFGVAAAIFWGILGGTSSQKFSLPRTVVGDTGLEPVTSPIHRDALTSKL